MERAPRSAPARPAPVGVPLHSQGREWDELAELDPYWAICTAPEKRFGGWSHDEFFATGEREVAEVLERGAELGLPRGRGAALDFGCGLGRLTRPLAERFHSCVGVDISERMVTGARDLNADVAGCSFEVNSTADLRPFPDASFDLVFSSVVLQHVPDRAAIESYLREFVRVLRPGGLAAFQLPAHIPRVFRLQWRRRLYRALRRHGAAPGFLYRRLRLVPIAMSHLPERRVAAVVEAAGGRLVRADSYRAAGLANAGVRSARYFVTR
jgi:SAM-dependent methyltransferase